MERLCGKARRGGGGASCPKMGLGSFGDLENLGSGRGWSGKLLFQGRLPRSSGAGIGRMVNGSTEYSLMLFVTRPVPPVGAVRVRFTIAARSYYDGADGRA